MNDYENEQEFSEESHEPEQQPEMKKPEPLDAKYVLSQKTSRPTVVSSGKHVDFVNDFFGIPGDEFTQETADAVRAYQRGKNLRETGVVDMTTYRML